jgi:hypothetical protein
LVLGVDDTGRLSDVSGTNTRAPPSFSAVWKMQVEAYDVVHGHVEAIVAPAG